jgi:hypothetical protein
MKEETSEVLLSAAWHFMVLKLGYFRKQLEIPGKF